MLKLSSTAIFFNMSRNVLQIFTSLVLKRSSKLKKYYAKLGRMFSTPMYSKFRCFSSARLKPFSNVVNRLLKFNLQRSLMPNCCSYIHRILKDEFHYSYNKENLTHTFLSIQAYTDLFSSKRK